MSDRKTYVPRAARLPNTGDASSILVQFLTKGLAKKVFDAVLVPMMVPSKDGYAHILTRDMELLQVSCPLPPIMTVSGGDVLKSLTRRGGSDLRTAVVMRPCEMRATLELVKLGQVDLSNLTIITMDCPGALPLSDFSKDPMGEMAKFEQAERGWEEKDLRRICQICDHMGMTSQDLHLGLREGDRKTVPMIASNEKGEKVLVDMGLALSEEVAVWQGRTREALMKRREQRDKWRQSFAPMVQGPDNLLGRLASCINCHNCMRVCPVCYCRVCYFDSERLHHGVDDYIDQAHRKGALRLPPDMMLFHIGRMTHMALTCVSCGACEDACPTAIPIAQMFSLVAERTQKVFEYQPGQDIHDPLPLTVYREEELEGDRND
jgi:formate dehydrogenase subunit beta